MTEVSDRRAKLRKTDIFCLQIVSNTNDPCIQQILLLKIFFKNTI